MAAAHHVIGKQLFHLTLSSQDGAFALQQELSRLNQERIVSKLSDLFDKMVPDDVYIQIEKLELDLGKLNSSRWEQEIEQKILETFEAQLKVALSQVSSPNGKVKLPQILQKPSVGRSWELFLHVLEFGYAPWWGSARLQDRETFEAEVLQALEKEPVLFQALRELYQRAPYVLRRLQTQFSPEYVNQVMAFAYPEFLPLLQNMEQEMVSVLHTVSKGQLSKGKLQSELRKLVLIDALTQGKAIKAETRILSQLLGKLAPELPLKGGLAEIQDAIRHEDSIPAQRKQFWQAIVAAISSAEEWQPGKLPLETAAESVELQTKLAEERAMESETDFENISDQEPGHQEGQSQSRPGEKELPEKDQTREASPDLPENQRRTDEWKHADIPDALVDFPLSEGPADSPAIPVEQADSALIPTDTTDSPRVPDEQADPAPMAEVPGDSPPVSEEPTESHSASIPDALTESTVGPDERSDSPSSPEERADSLPQKDPSDPAADREAEAFEDTLDPGSEPSPRNQPALGDGDKTTPENAPDSEGSPPFVAEPSPKPESEKSGTIPAEKKLPFAIEESGTKEDKATEEAIFATADSADKDEAEKPERFSQEEPGSESIQEKGSEETAPKTTDKDATAEPGEFAKDEEDLSTSTLAEEEGDMSVEERGSSMKIAQEKKKAAPPFTKDRLAAREAPDLPPGEFVYVNNAGLILLHPFIYPFLEKLGCSQNRAFVDQEAREKAVHLLQFLATGEENSPEPLLLLNKVLCDIPLQMPIEREIPLSVTEKEEGEKLLLAVIGHWEALKNTSIGGLREGFFKRDGKLIRKEDRSWLLQIEQKTRDILLNRLPWGYSMVKLPWMKDILFVEWA